MFPRSTIYVKCHMCVKTENIFWNLPTFTQIKKILSVKGDVEITEQPLSKIDIHSAVIDLHDGASIQAYPSVLGINIRSFDRKILSFAR
nr:probable inactive purple acid phosphatase 27 [Tanacetum cinerariifolium]